jgi:hypothetical protein
MNDHEYIQTLRAIFCKNKCLVVLMLKVNEKLLTNLTDDNCIEGYTIVKELENIYHNLQMSSDFLEDKLDEYDSDSDSYDTDDTNGEDSDYADSIH